MQMCLFVSFSASISCHRHTGFTGAVTLPSLEATHVSNPGHSDRQLITLPVTQTTTLENKGKAGGIKRNFAFKLG